MISLPFSQQPFLAANAYLELPRPYDGEVFLSIALASIWLTATLISYGALLMALKTRFSRRAPAKRNRRLPKILRVSYRQGLLALVGVVLYLGYYIYRFSVYPTRSWDAETVARMGTGLAETAAIAGPFAVAAVISLGASLIWMRRLQRVAA
ncbi:hypothetical protein [Roseimicrobium sp. ORNL1]|uniref:hypothetical protein n=1 Tax=Roseimicrobium sp. ORNL1 TaxID=2711231 RepID=UPI0013E129F0|nr:hypothetical protein [Roseimicrobium sp. ORNL1]QIF02097.1 hypothetical protein G5S37_11320 [Roseimicrobium sp. ORNL1]